MSHLTRHALDVPAMSYANVIVLLVSADLANVISDHTVGKRGPHPLLGRRFFLTHKFIIHLNLRK